ncbi:cupin domain-containing protein [Leptolyngbya cf. ectocarpi LEGE 11479]|uniref:Cupin domain-containing protein n=1 Tax=Leptolyngbya cf. ectocarpi LEGE 11479 TaxID=1828722 RepID=A0A928ZUE9_LEPEC|nr:cupin domain-containing protein [Leptolyngbya ectocarpi]MBE9067605.1 cupin domain-containing protein [Leptolyngbya cf. ectocarpi LEGE 11479]
MISPDPYQNADAVDAAAIYALDGLGADERGQFEQALLDSADLEQTVRGFEETAAALAYGAPPVPMATDLKARLFQRIAGQPNGASSDLLKLLDLPIAELKQKATELDWCLMPGDSGVTVATWQTDDVFREAAFFARKVGKGLFPNHYHASGETVLVLEGDFVVDAQAYYPGERVTAPGKTSHQPESLSGCLLLCVSSMDDDVLDV